MKLYASNAGIEHVEHHIRPHMPTVVTIPIMIDDVPGLRHGIVIYVATVPTLDGRIDDRLLADVAREVLMRVANNGVHE